VCVGKGSVKVVNRNEWYAKRCVCVCVCVMVVNPVAALLEGGSKRMPRRRVPLIDPNEPEYPAARRGERARRFGARRNHAGVIRPL